MQLLNGRWGPYLKVGKSNYKLPKGTEPTTLTYEDCLQIMKEAPEKKGRGAAKSAATKPAAKKPAAKKPAAKKKTATKKKVTKK